MDNGGSTVTTTLMSRLNVTDSHSKREFIAINAITCLGATGKDINTKPGYIKPTSLSEYTHEISDKTEYIRDSSIERKELSNLSIEGPLASIIAVSIALIPFVSGR